MYFLYLVILHMSPSKYQKWQKFNLINKLVT
jgi:hypothetical protein